MAALFDHLSLFNLGLDIVFNEKYYLNKLLRKK